MSVREVSVQTVTSESSTKQEKLGSRVRTPDGREFVYAQDSGSGQTAGQLAVNADEVANHVNIAVAAAAAIGDTKVSVTLGATAATADQYGDGYLVVNDANGEGQTVPIAGHAAIASAGTGTIVLAEPLTQALTTSSQVQLVQPWSTKTSVADQADRAVGVPAIDVTASYYHWTQVKGHAAVLADEAVTKGLALTIGSSVAGAVEAADLVGEQVIGVAEQALVDTEYRVAYLNI